MCTRKELCAENSKDTLEWSELSKQTFLMIISSECIKSGEPQQPPTVTLPQILPISSTLSRVTEFISVSLNVVTSILNVSVSSLLSWPVLLFVHKYNSRSKPKNIPHTRGIDSFGAYLHTYRLQLCSRNDISEVWQRFIAAISINY